MVAPVGSSSENRPLPTFTFFLDVDGVLIRHIGYEDQPARILKICEERFPDRVSNPDDPTYTNRFHKYTRLEWLHAASALFDPAAVRSLKELFETAQRTHSVSIVISSAWRVGIGLEDLKTKIFGETGFAHLITDKVQESQELRGIEIRRYLDGKIDEAKGLYLILDDVMEGMNNHLFDHIIFVPQNWLFNNDLKHLALIKLDAISNDEPEEIETFEDLDVFALFSVSDDEGTV